MMNTILLPSNELSNTTTESQYHRSLQLTSIDFAIEQYISSLSA